MSKAKTLYRFRSFINYFSQKNCGYISLVVIAVVLLAALLAGGLTTTYNVQSADTLTPTSPILPVVSGSTVPSTTVSPTTSGCLHVQDAQILDCNNAPVILRGAMMESSF